MASYAFQSKVTLNFLPQSLMSPAALAAASSTDVRSFFSATVSAWASAVAARMAVVNTVFSTVLGDGVVMSSPGCVSKSRTLLLLCDRHRAVRLEHGARVLEVERPLLGIVLGRD